MGDKPRLLFVGGKPFNVPKQLHDHFEIVRHIEQDERKVSTLPGADYIVVLTNWVNHTVVQQAIRELPGTPVVYVRAGWKSMSEEFVRRGMMKAPPEPVPDDAREEEKEEPEPSPSGEPRSEPKPMDGHSVLKRADDYLAEYLLLKEERERLAEELKRARTRLEEADAKIARLQPIADAMGSLTEAVKMIEKG